MVPTLHRRIDRDHRILPFSGHDHLFADPCVAAVQRQDDRTLPESSAHRRPSRGRAGSSLPGDLAWMADQRPVYGFITGPRAAGSCPPREPVHSHRDHDVGIGRPKGMVKPSRETVQGVELHLARRHAPARLDKPPRHRTSPRRFDRLDLQQSMMRQVSPPRAHSKRYLYGRACHDRPEQRDHGPGDGTPADGAAVQRNLQEMAKGVLQGQVLVDLVGGPDGETIELPALPANVIDTTGAGDAFAAGFLLGGTLREMAERGLAAAARCVATLGSMPL